MAMRFLDGGTLTKSARTPSVRNFIRKPGGLRSIRTEVLRQDRVCALLIF